MYPPRDDEGSDARSRVLVVAPQPFYEDRGTPIAIRQLLEALTQLGYSVDLLTFPGGRSIDLPGVRLFKVSNPFGIRNVPIGFSLRKLALDGSLAAALRRRLRDEHYDCVHAVEEAGFLAVLLANGDVPVIYDMQSSLPEQLTKNFIFRGRLAQAALKRCERWLLGNADLVISSTGLASGVRAVSPSTSIEEWSFFSDPSAVDPSEVAELRSSLGLAETSKVILYTGTFEKYQGIPILLDAVQKVRRAVPEAAFVLVGARGEELNGDMRRAMTLDRAGSLKLLERQPRERIPVFLAMADILVSPRLYGNNLPLKIFDYLAAGRPIVATDNPSHRAVLSEDCAVLVPAEPAELATALIGLLRDREKAERLAEAAREYARIHLSWMSFVNSVDSIYSRAIR